MHWMRTPLPTLASGDSPPCPSCWKSCWTGQEDGVKPGPPARRRLDHRARRFVESRKGAPESVVTLANPWEGGKALIFPDVSENFTGAAS